MFASRFVSNDHPREWFNGVKHQQTSNPNDTLYQLHIGFSLHEHSWLFVGAFKYEVVVPVHLAEASWYVVHLGDGIVGFKTAILQLKQDFIAEDLGPLH